MTTVGKLYSASPVSTAANEQPAQETRMFKVGNFPVVLMQHQIKTLDRILLISVLQFGELQVALTADKAYIGAVIAFTFG